MPESAERDRLLDLIQSQGQVEVEGRVNYAASASFSYTSLDGHYLVTVTKGTVTPDEAVETTTKAEEKAAKPKTEAKDEPVKAKPEARDEPKAAEAVKSKSEPTAAKSPSSSPRAVRKGTPEN